MNYRGIQRFYSKIIYLELIDNTIRDYSKVLNEKTKEMMSGNISHEEYDLIRNKKKIDMIKQWNYYYNLSFY